MKIKKEKKFNDFIETHPIQLDFFELLDVHDNKRDKYSGIVGLYDCMPKYVIRVDNSKQNVRNLIITREFVYDKKNMTISISPALIKQKNGETKVFYPTAREGIIEDVLRKFTTDPIRNSFLDDRLSVKFTIYDLRKELKRVNHEYSYSEIKESLEILSKTNIEIKTQNGKITFSSNMFETFGIIDGNDKDKFFIDKDEREKKIIYFVRFNSLVSNSIKDGTWKILNYEQYMKYKFFLSRWLHKKISNMFMTKTIEIPYNIKLSTIIRDSGTTEYESIRLNLPQVEKSLKEMVNIGSISKYESVKEYDKDKKNKIKDVLFLIYISDSFLKDLSLNYFIKDKYKLKAVEIDKEKNKNVLTKKEQKEIGDINKDNNNFKKEIQELLSKYDLSSKDINKIIFFRKKKSDESIKNNILSAIEYIEKESQRNKQCNVMAIIIASINYDWSIQKQLFYDNNKNNNDIKNEEENNNSMIAKDKINKIINKSYKKISRELLKYFGVDIYVAWLSELNFVEIDKYNILVLSCNNSFVVDTIKKDYLNGIKKKVDGKDVWVKKGIKQVVQDAVVNIEDVEIVYEK